MSLKSGIHDTYIVPSDGDGPLFKPAVSFRNESVLTFTIIDSDVLSIPMAKAQILDDMADTLFDWIQEVSSGASR